MKHLNICQNAMLGAIVAFIGVSNLTADEVAIETNKDVGFFDVAPTRNMGQHDHVPVGEANNGRTNHSIFAFPILDNLSAGATIDSATLQFEVSQQGGSSGSNPATFAIYRVTKNWNEGTGQSSGGMATMDGATWLSATGLDSWDTAGGDFVASDSGSVFVSGAGVYTISSSQLVADVQAIVDGDKDDFGFLMRATQNIPGSASRVLSRESGKPATLTISFTADDVLLGDVNLDGVVDLLDVAPFVALLSSGMTQAEADINGDGKVDLTDIQPFVQLLSGS